MIVQILLVALVMVVLFSFFAFALNFSKYKKRPGTEGCCGGGHCDTDEHDDDHSCGCYDEKMKFVEKYDALNKKSCGDQCSCGNH